MTRTKLWLNGLLLLASIAGSFFLLEFAVRCNPFHLFYPATSNSWMATPGEHVIERNFLKAMPEHTNGVQPNPYSINKRAGVERLLFMGDSVTAGGKIVNGLKTMYGEDRFEYWNAGSGGLNTRQEVELYKNFNKFTNPDKVLLQFHLNDFEETPVAYFSDKNQIEITGYSAATLHVNTFLFKRSALYRLWFLRFYLRKIFKQRLEKEYRDAAYDSLKELRDILARDKIPLTVYINPTLKPYKKWSKFEKTAREMIIEILKNLRIRYFDLTDALDGLFKEHIYVNPEDPWHPTREAGLYFAKYLHQKGLLEES